MAPRALGALLALVAALLFVASLAGAVVPADVPGWWDGHPKVGAKTFDHKAIHVGLLGAYGCNLGEQVECETLQTGALLEPIGIAELVALGLVTLTTLALFVSIWRIGERRKGLGRIVVIEALIAAAIAAAWIAIGPDITAGSVSVGVPIGLGLYAFGGGAVAAVLAGLLARKVEHEPLRLKTSMPRIQQVPQPAFDVRELVRPSAPALAHEPAHAAYPRTPVSSPGGALAGPAGPLAPPAGAGAHVPLTHPVNAAGHTPLFDNAPQLRPLYDMANVGVVPAPAPPQLPARAPTPIPRASFAETSEFQRSTPLPPRAAAAAPQRPSPEPPPPPAQAPELEAPLHRSPTPPTSPSPRAASTSAPPAARIGLRRAETPLAEPPPPAAAIAPAPPTRHSPNPSRAHRHSPNPPPADRHSPNPPPARTKAASLPPRQLSSPMRSVGGASPEREVSKHPTIAHAIPPMPILAPTPREPTEAEPSTAVEVDAEAKAKWQAAQAAKARTLDLRAEPDPAAASKPTADLRAEPDPAVPGVADTAETPVAEQPPADSDEIPTRAVGRVSASELPTRAVERVSASELAPPPGPPPPAATPAVTADKADFESIDRTPRAARPSAPGLKLQPISVPKIIAPVAASKEPQRPSPLPPTAKPAANPTPDPDEKPAILSTLSTAPASLPPPKKAPPATSGPTPACPQCEAPMAWVEEHLRFYCAQCRMYF